MKVKVFFFLSLDPKFEQHVHVHFSTPNTVVTSINHVFLSHKKRTNVIKVLLYSFTMLRQENGDVATSKHSRIDLLDGVLGPVSPAKHTFSGMK